MTLTDRDRKIVFALIPLVIIGAYWFLLLAPKRQEAATIKDQLTAAQGVRDTAQQKAAQLAGAKRSFAADYATVIRLGKSIPTSVDMPSLLVQLDRAARGTGIKFSDVKVGLRSGATASATPGAAATPTPTGGAHSPAAAGAAPAQSAPGKAAQSAGNSVNSANGNTAAAAAAAGSTAGATAVGGGTVGLESVPLDFEFSGNFFSLADFLHRMKRFVRVTNNQIVIRGRLLTIDSFSFDSSTFPDLKAQIHATVYLAPKAQGIGAGATPQGPTLSGTGTTQQSASSSSSPSIPTPAATVTSR